MKIVFLMGFVFLSACSGGAGLNLGQYPDAGATKDNFEYCHGYGCTKKIRLGFNNHEWTQIAKIFEKESVDAQSERIKIGQAVALMEQYTGKLAGTNNDLAKAPIIRKNYQELDCIDETLNTTKYLNFLADAKFFKFHKAGSPTFKVNLITGIYPHNTATVVEIETGDVYVIDSYIQANGLEPNIRSLESWKKYRVEEINKANNFNRL